MGEPTTSFGRLVGTFFISNTPPTTEELGKPITAGMCWIDSDGTNNSWCCYTEDGTIGCAVLSSAAPTTTSTTTTTTSTSTTAT